LWGGREGIELNVKKYRIEFLIKVNEEISQKQVEEWARFIVGDTGRLSLDNPLHDESFDPVFGTFKIEAQ